MSAPSMDPQELAKLIAALQEKASKESAAQAKAIEEDEQADADPTGEKEYRNQGRIPVTVLTGFLGSGKTTLLNHILTSTSHKLRIAVIENEFGEVGIDQGLIKGKGDTAQLEEQLVEMNNGCICCTVRGDLQQFLRKLWRRSNKAPKDKKIQHVLIETTGMADPAPVAQTFFVDEFIESKYRLEGIVTVVDSFHLLTSLGHSKEAMQQIAFADMILMNKIDLISNPEDLKSLISKVRSINAAATIYETKHSVVDPRVLLKIGGFNVRRALTVSQDFFKPEQPFEFASTYTLQGGKTYQLVIPAGPDESMKVVIAPANQSVTPTSNNTNNASVAPTEDTDMEGDEEKANNDKNDVSAGKLVEIVSIDIPLAIKSQSESAMQLFSENREFKNKPSKSNITRSATLTNKVSSNGTITVQDKPVFALLDLTSGDSKYNIEISTSGEYILYTEHQPVEYYKEDNNIKGWRIEENNSKNIDINSFYCFKPSHEHDLSVSSVGIEINEPLNEKKLNNWLGKLLREKGNDLYRSKGILWLDGWTRRYVFHAVHMLWNGVADRIWLEDEKKTNQMIFIGKNLNRQELTQGFLDCVQKV